MILTELTTGLRRIELAALQILSGVVPDCGDQGCGKTLAARGNGSSGLGRSFLMRDSSQQIQREQSHLRVICRCWPFWASLALGLRVSWRGALARIRAERTATTRRSGSGEAHDSH
jgi:hypothetical protein